MAYTYRVNIGPVKATLLKSVIREEKESFANISEYFI